MRKATKIGFIGVFCAVIGLAFPIFNIFSKQLSMDSHENRLMTGLPQVLHSPLRELPRNLDNFLVDNSPLPLPVCAGQRWGWIIAVRHKPERSGAARQERVAVLQGWPNAAQPMANYQGLTELNGQCRGAGRAARGCRS